MAVCVLPTGPSYSTLLCGHGFRVCRFVHTSATFLGRLGFAFAVRQAQHSEPTSAQLGDQAGTSGSAVRALLRSVLRPAGTLAGFNLRQTLAVSGVNGAQELRG